MVLERERQQKYFVLESKIVGAAEYGISYESTVGWRECVIVSFSARLDTLRKHLLKCVNSSEVLLFLSFSDAVIASWIIQSEFSPTVFSGMQVMPKSEQVLIIKMC